MIFLLDTNAFSDLMEERAQVVARLSGIASIDRAIICPIVLGEIQHGIVRLPQSRRRSELEIKAARVFAVLPCESVPEAAGDHYARIKTTRQQHGMTMNENDLWIAATALALGATLVSRDSDFQQIVGLTVID